MSEARSFIPIGSCVEGPTAAYFDVPGAESMAQQACSECPQLEQCSDEREVIGALVVRNGSLAPVVAGRKVAVSLQSVRNIASEHQTFGEVTLGSFDVVPLPSDGQRALRGIQRAVRLGRIARYDSVTHPTEDMDAYYQAALEASDPENAAYAAEATLSLRYAVSALLWVTAEREPNGALRRPHLRYGSFDAERHVPYVSSFMNEARRIKELGLPQHEAKLTLFHSVEYYQRYLETGRAQGITDSRLGQALTKSPRDPLPVAQQLKARQAQNTRRNAEQQRQISDLPQDIQDMIIQRAPNPEKTLADIQQFRRHKILAISPKTGKLRLHESLSYFRKSEQRAILFALDVPGLTIPRTANEPPLDVSLASKVLVPHLYSIRRAGEIIPGTAGPRALAILRRDIWSGQIALNRDITLLPDMLPASYFESLVKSAALADIKDSDVAQAVQGLQQLYAATVRYFVRRDRKVSISDFEGIGTAYVQDWYRIWGAGQRKASQVALYYSADTYTAIAAYAATEESTSEGMVSGAFASSVRAPLRPIRARQRCFAEIKNLPEAATLKDSVINNLASRGLDAKSALPVLAALQEAERRYADVLDSRTVQRVYTLYKLADAPELLRAKALVAQEYREQYGDAPFFWAIYDAIDRAKQGDEATKARAVVQRIETVRTTLNEMQAPEIDEFVITHIAFHEGGNMDWLDGYYERLRSIDALPFAGELTDSARHKLATVSTDEEVVSNAQFFHRRLTRALAAGLTNDVMERRLSYDLGWLNIPIRMSR